MKTSSRKRIGASVTAAVLSVLALSTALAPQASAAAGPQERPVASSSSNTVKPLSASGCAVDTCIYVSDPANGQVEVDAWAYQTTFYGYLHFTGPNGLNKISGPATWLGHRGNHAYIGAPAVVGRYCVHGYLPDGYDEGTACENIT